METFWREKLIRIQRKVIQYFPKHSSLQNNIRIFKRDQQLVKLHDPGEEDSSS